MSNNDIFFMPAWKMAEKIKNQEFTSLEITQAIIERIKKVNPIINAYCIPTFDSALKKAKQIDNRIRNNEKVGKIAGVPISIKDEMRIKGVRTTYGSKIFENNIAEEDEITVKRLKKEDVVILGKTNMPEFGHHGYTRNLVFGETVNPWNTNKATGGSSGGAAAAIASGLGPLGLGADGGGSIRAPCSFCGLFGIKATQGRVPVHPENSTLADTLLDQYGPLARNVKDAALMLDILKGPYEFDKFSLPTQNISYFDHVDEIQKNLKIGYSLDLGFVKALDPEVEKMVIESVYKFEELDYNIEKVKIKLRKPEFAFNIIYTTYFAYEFAPLLKEWKDRMTPSLVRMIEAGLSFNAIDYMKALDIRSNLYERVAQYFKDYDILITPTTAIPAFNKEEEPPMVINGKSVPPTTFTAFTFPFNLTGHPAASIPCGWSKEHTPIGMQIVGNRFEDLKVLQVAKAFENIAPWQDKRPNLL
ncbi:MAG: amidase [Candidatus Lokiarchaeota archaeon]|nr:amidase [Candidatus Lokiarchaeota archaeon]